MLSLDANFDVTITGFEIPEIDLLLLETTDHPDVEDSLVNVPTGPPVTQVGDLWQLGKHRLLCGSALDAQSFRSLLGTRRAKAVFVDPPFNLRIDGHVSGNGVNHHREFAMASGEMDELEFISFLKGSLGLLARFSTDGSLHYVCMDWRHVSELLAAGRQIYDRLLNLCVWAKDNGGMGSFYRSQHELIFVFQNGKGAHSNNVQLGKYGRNRTNVWRYPGANTLSKSGQEWNLLALHPTVKPVALVADALLDCSARGDIVMDSFLGSGTTLLAAERVGRVFCGMELDPIYVDTAIRRWQQYSGEKAVLTRTSDFFNDLEASRG